MNIGLLLLRLLLGLTLAAHGSQKLFGWFGGGGIANTGMFFESKLGFRPGKTHAALAGLAEFGGGALVVLGLFTPLACAAIVGVMLVAGWSAHGQNGFFITKGGYEYTVLLGGLAAGLAFTGPGRFSVDHAFGWHLEGAVWGCVAVLFGLVAGACLMAGRGRLREAEPAPTAESTTPAESVGGGREVGMNRSETRTEA
jgi:putative oxidoreductase